jgi:hypothetical protein
MSTASRLPQNWATGAFVQRNLHVSAIDQTQFDELVSKNGLEKRPDLWPHNDKLKRFARANKNRRYIPEWLLETWGMVVKAD